MSDTAPPAISVVIPCYNATATIDLALEALSRQIDAPSFEVLLVDNRSTDGLAAHVERWRDAFLAFRVVSAPHAQGVSYARNVGIGAADHPTIAICDADDCVSQYWLRDMALALQEADVVSGAALPTPDARFTSVEDIWEWLDVDTDYRPARVPAPPETYPIMMGGNCAFPKALAVELNGFDQSYVAGSDDTDFAFRVSRAGHRIAHSSSARIAYRDRPNSSALLRQSYRRAVMHTLLCARFDTWTTSPNLPRGWKLTMVRGLGALALMMVGVKRSDRQAAISRIGLGAGFLIGWLKYGVFKRIPRRALGAGLDDA